MKTEAANAAHDAVSLMNEPTPPITGSSQSVLSSNSIPAELLWIEFTTGHQLLDNQNRAARDRYRRSRRAP